MKKVRGEQEQGLKKKRQQKKGRDKPYILRHIFQVWLCMLMGILESKIYRVIRI